MKTPITSHCVPLSPFALVVVFFLFLCAEITEIGSEFSDAIIFRVKKKEKKSALRAVISSHIHCVFGGGISVSEYVYFTFCLGGYLSLPSGTTEYARTALVNITEI